jgi:hypothetical protein
MSMFYVAIYSHFEGSNMLFKIQSDNEFDAVKKALFLHAESTESRNSDYDDWVNNFKDIDDLRQQCTNCDLSISKVIQHKNEKVSIHTKN